MSRLLIVLLLAAATRVALAQNPNPLKPPPHGGLSLHGVKQALGHFFAGKRGLLCSDCIHLAVEIDHLLYKPPNVASDDANIAASGPGRRMQIPNKEIEIYAALDAACGKLADNHKLGEDVMRDCRRLMGEHRRALEASIFSKGTAALATTMCVSELKLCDPHNLMDSGEL